MEQRLMKHIILGQQQRIGVTQEPALAKVVLGGGDLVRQRGVESLYDMLTFSLILPNVLPGYSTVRTTYHPGTVHDTVHDTMIHTP